MSTTMSITATPLPAALMTPTKATILIVEDDVGVARLERQHLERAHYRVLTAGTADHALALLDHGIDEPERLDLRQGAHEPHERRHGPAGAPGQAEVGEGHGVTPRAASSRRSWRSR